MSLIMFLSMVLPPFFHVQRGLRQVCPLSALVSLLVMEGLSQLISEERRLGRLQGIKITNNFIISHLLFVDGVLIFLNVLIGDTSIFFSILKSFYLSTGIECNQQKSTMIAIGFSQYGSYFEH